MKEKIEKRVFANRLEHTARELKERVDSGEGRAYILIGSDRIEYGDEDGGGIRKPSLLPPASRAK